MGFQAISLNFLATFIVTIHQFETTLVIFKETSGEVFFTMGARHESLGAGIEHVVFHQGPGNLGTALVQAIQSVLLTYVQMSL